MVQIHSPRPYFQLRSLDYARDFGSGLRRPLNASSSNPFAPTTPFPTPYIHGQCAACLGSRGSDSYSEF